MRIGPQRCLQMYVVASALSSIEASSSRCHDRHCGQVVAICASTSGPDTRRNGMTSEANGITWLPGPTISNGQYPIERPANPVVSSRAIRARRCPRHATGTHAGSRDARSRVIQRAADRQLWRPGTRSRGPTEADPRATLYVEHVAVRLRVELVVVGRGAATTRRGVQ